MLQAKNLLDALAEKDTSDVYDQNNDFDFGEVLKFCNSGQPKTQGHKLRYSDGQERTFSFDDN
ncbi:hypothetical protein C823_003014 [Eubacterium plexicaudatum ASF492]|uniref:Uncharacterized protein n=1 Tax=Eubacterium plexicaudatum ASF492 TaxID=1235802 RepID=N2ACV8_9FIRM|nr:hypothetical protein C823_003014 [Eubacterium plexicaudatum ASF492]